MGAEIKNHCSNLEGIDLSNEMLKELEKGVYKKLTQANIEEYLADVPLDFDCFISADVFVYVGDLSNVPFN